MLQNAGRPRQHALRCRPTVLTIVDNPGVLDSDSTDGAAENATSLQILAQKGARITAYLHLAAADVSRTFAYHVSRTHIERRRIVQDRTGLYEQLQAAANCRDCAPAAK